MAAIDKFYTHSYDEYKQFLEWARDASYVTPRGVKVKVIDYINQNLSPDIFEKYEIPLFNSPTHFDNYLYHNCPLPFIQEWLKEVYSGQGYCKGSPEEITTIPKKSTLPVCKKVKIPKHMKQSAIRSLWVQIETGGYYYNRDYDFWTFPDEIDEWTTNTADVGSIKALIRKIRKKWKLPAGVTIIVTRFGNYSTERYKIYTK